MARTYRERALALLRDGYLWPAGGHLARLIVRQETRRTMSYDDWKTRSDRDEPPDHVPICDGEPSCNRVGCAWCDDHYGRFAREQERPPLVAGGQGRSAEEVQDSSLALFVGALSGAAAVAFLWWLS